MKTQYNDYNLNCAAVDRAGINKRQYHANKRKKKVKSSEFKEILDKAMTERIIKKWWEK